MKNNWTAARRRKDKQTEIEIQAGKHTENVVRDRRSNSLIVRQTCRQIDRQTDTCRQTDRQTDRPTYRQACIQTDRETDMQAG